MARQKAESDLNFTELMGVRGRGEGRVGGGGHLAASEDHLAGNEDEQHNLGLHHVVDEPGKELGLRARPRGSVWARAPATGSDRAAIMVSASRSSRLCSKSAALRRVGYFWFLAFSLFVVQSITAFDMSEGM